MKKTMFGLLALAAVAVMAVAGTFVSLQQGPPGIVASAAELDTTSSLTLATATAIGLGAAVFTLAVFLEFGGRLRRSPWTDMLSTVMSFLQAGKAIISRLVLMPQFVTSRSVRT